MISFDDALKRVAKDRNWDESEEKPKIKPVTLPYMRFLDNKITPDPKLYDNPKFSLAEWRKNR
jgi:hypothetical protein